MSASASYNEVGLFSAIAFVCFLSHYDGKTRALAVNCPVFSSSLYTKASLISIFSSRSPADQVISLTFLKRDGISDQTLAVPGVQHFFSWVIGHHGVVAELIGELNVGVPLPSSLGVVSKVDGRGL